jgi:hypothetical protein
MHCTGSAASGVVAAVSISRTLVVTDKDIARASLDVRGFVASLRVCRRGA